MSENTNFGFGGFINDQDESLKAKNGSYARFGLNQNVTVSRFQYADTKEDGTPIAVPSLTIYFKIGDGEVFYNIYQPSGRIYFKNEQIGPEHPDYQEAWLADLTQKKACMLHIAKALGADEIKIKERLEKPVATYKELCEIFIQNLPANWMERKVDLFMEYQSKIKEGNDRTYPVVPTNMKSGYFIHPHVDPRGGEWQEQMSWTELDEEGREVTVQGIRYVDGDGNVHPIKKDSGFLTLPKSKQQLAQGANPSGPQGSQAIQGNTPQNEVAGIQQKKAQDGSTLW